MILKNTSEKDKLDKDSYCMFSMYILKTHKILKQYNVLSAYTEN